MKSSYQVAGAYVLAVACIASAAATAITAHAQSASKATPRATSSGSEKAVLRQMVGTWDVAQRIWPSPNTEPIRPPPAVARRRLINDIFLEEVMEPVPGSGQEPFTRIAYFNFNEVTQRYEAISMDTRAPQMMYEKSFEDGARSAGKERRTVRLYLEDNFVLPRWGKTANAAFKGRKVIEIGPDRQVVRLYWTPLGGERAQEFLAGEYVYTRHR